MSSNWSWPACATHTGSRSTIRRVREEWLYGYPERRRRILFERDGEGAIGFGTTIPEQRGKTEVLGELIRPNALFLSLAGHANIDPLLPVYRWFAEGLQFHGKGPPRLDVERVAQYLSQDPERRRGFVQLLAEADLGISDLRVELDEESTLQNYLRTREAMLAGRRTELPETELSAWIARLDSSLHPRLTAYLVGLFQDPRTNPHNSQLIFTTHDTTLLGNVLGEQVLERDQVWFVEKANTGGTKLYPLTDFRQKASEKPNGGIWLAVMARCR